MAQLELKPQLIDERTDNHSESENTETQVTSEIEPDTDKESPKIPEKTSGDIKKGNTNEPLKRSTSTKQSSNSITSSGAKATTSSVNRNAAPLKSSSKSASVPSIRRSTAQSTTHGTRHASSVYSSGGSGDEKRKSLISATRRTSLTPISQHQPIKVESLAEKRGISGVVARKPTTSANTVSLKPIARSNSTASKSASIIKRSSSVNTKSSTSGTLSDSTKRLSTAPGSVITAKPLARNSSISAEVDRLKVKLELSTTKIDDQENEIKTTRENVEKLRKQLEEEIQKSALTEENLKKDYREKIVKLGNDHETKLQFLQSELEKSQSAVVNAQEISAKSVEEALEKEALKSANTIQELKDGFETMLSSLNTQLTDTKDNCASLASELTEKETEIQSLNSKIIKANEQQKTLQQEYENSISNLRQSLLEEKEVALSTLRAECNELALKQDNQMKSDQDKETAALTEKYESKIIEIQTVLDNTKASLVEAEKNHKKILETNSNESKSKISILQSEISFLKSELDAKSASLTESVKSKKDLEGKYESLKQEYASLSNKFKELENQHSIELQDQLSARNELIRELSVASDDLRQVKAQLAQQTQMMKTFNDDGKSKDESYKKKMTELEVATKKLNENEIDIANLKEKLAEFEKTSQFQNETIIRLREELAVKEGAKIGNNNPIEHHRKILSDKSKELNEAENNYRTQLRSLENKITVTSNQACQKLQEAHRIELEELKINYEDAVSKLQHDHKSSLSIIKELQTTRTDLEKQFKELKNELTKTQNDLATNQQHLEREKRDKVQALADLDAFQSREKGTPETRHLNSKWQEQGTKDEAENDQITKTAVEELQEESRKEKVESKDQTARPVEKENQDIEITESRLKETEALLKMKDAVISEAKISSSKDGLTSNNLTFVEMNVSEENEGEQDHSSAALASVINIFASKLAQAKVLAQQVIQMMNEHRNNILGPLPTLAETPPKTLCYDDELTKEV
ncbi:putative viral a-type inclusion protein repeat domain-containing protein [Erysiphe neolycopersici]|uniref:Putative viral a-type inclusion protein repeat domain-containing protein n=1 Tax=Erysiphe neolycopersici TaxID=212602 RepID=A0A420HWJ3_9PEZI|nr:putative viral a-type inclusion protein repeat domain-containing protein [Erysiphe neolycopersici]